MLKLMRNGRKKLTRRKSPESQSQARLMLTLKLWNNSLMLCWLEITKHSFGLMLNTTYKRKWMQQGNSKAQICTVKLKLKKSTEATILLSQLSVWIIMQWLILENIWISFMISFKDAMNRTFSMNKLKCCTTLVLMLTLLRIFTTLLLLLLFPLKKVMTTTSIGLITSRLFKIRWAIKSKISMNMLRQKIW